MRHPQTLTVARAALPEIYAAEPGARGMMDLGVYLTLLDLAAASPKPFTISLRELSTALQLSRNTLVRAVRRLEKCKAILTATVGQDGVAVVFMHQAP